MTYLGNSDGPDRSSPSLWAISDLHVSVAENRAFVDELGPSHDDDWLIVAGDVDEDLDKLIWALSTLSNRFAQVIWVPGNHELWTPRGDVHDTLRGQARYDHLIDIARGLGIATPEDPYLEWVTSEETLSIVALFLLYDYSYDFAIPNTTKTARLRVADARGVVCSDEFLLHPDPYRSIDEWCAARLEYSRQRLSELPSNRRTVLVNHFPLKARLTRPLHHPEFAMWCGTNETTSWHLEYRARAVVYGHLHIPRTTMIDGIPFDDVSLGYPRERERLAAYVGELPALPRHIVSGVASP